MSGWSLDADRILSGAAESLGNAKPERASREGTCGRERHGTAGKCAERAGSSGSVGVAMRIGSASSARSFDMCHQRVAQIIPCGAAVWRGGRQEWWLQTHTKIKHSGSRITQPLSRR